MMYLQYIIKKKEMFYSQRASFKLYVYFKHCRKCLISIFEACLQRFLYFLRLQLKVVFMFQSATCVLRCIDSCVGVCFFYPHCQSDLIVLFSKGDFICADNKQSQQSQQT